MATNIDRLSFLMEADVSQFEEGMRLTQGELKGLQRVMRRTEEPSEKLARDIQRLEKAVEAGGEGTELFRRELERLRKKKVDLERRTNRYTDATNKQARSLKQVGRELSRDIPLFGRLADGLDRGGGAFIAGTAAIAGFTAGMYATVQAARAATRAISEQLQEVDKIAKASRKLGTTTDELVGLQFAAAELSGMADTQVSTAIQRMTRRIAEAANGSGEAKDAIAELGLEAAELAQKSPAEAFKDIAESIKSVGNESQQLRIAFKLFDSEGASLVTTLAAGRQGLERMEQRARELGLTFSDLQAKQIEAANDALFEAQAALDGTARSASIVLAPALEDAAKHFASITTGADTSVESLANLQNRVRIYAAAVRDSLTKGFMPDEQLSVAGQLLAESLTSDIGNAFGGESGQQHRTVAEQAQRQQQERENEEKAVADTINAQLDALRQQNALIGASREEAERYKLEMMGATDAQLRQLEAAQQARAHLERWQAADEDRRKKERQQAEKAGEQARAMQELGRPGAAEKGSREALLAIQGIRDKAAQDRQRQIALEQKQVEQGKQTNKLLAQMNRRNGPKLQGVG